MSCFNVLLLLHLALLTGLALDKVLAVRPDGLQAHEEGHHVLGRPVQVLLVAGAALEVVGPQLGFRSSTARGSSSMGLRPHLKL